jgi:hypothetical protein
MRRLILLTLFAILVGVVPARPVLARPAPRTRASRPPRCQPKDEFVPLAHGDGGGVWIPKELACGGRAPVVIMLHGNNSDRVGHVSLGGGRTLEELARALMDEQEIRPVILAEPVHFRSCGGGLYGESYDFPGYRAKLEKLLASRHIQVQAYSVMGHSGAGCCGGVFRAAEAFGPLKLLGLIDTCYTSSNYARDVHEYFDDRGTIVCNVSRGEPAYARYRDYEQEVLGPHPFAIACNTDVYRRCLRSSRRPFYSLTTTRTDGPYHSEIPSDSYRTMLMRFFPAGGAPTPRIATRP